MPRTRSTLFWLAVLAPSTLFAAPFAEGYSSAEPGAPALLYYRAFTLTEGREACESGPRASSLRIRLPSATLKVGDRFNRMNGNPSTRMNLVIEARDANGALVPSVPIVVDVSADASSDGEVFMTRSDLDYVEAIAPGKFSLSAQIYCDYSNLSTRVTLTVEE